MIQIDPNLISPIAFLGGNIFGAFTDKKQTLEIINHSLDNGIFAIDTANVYSDGLSEEYIGYAIKDKREHFFIATKNGLKSHEKSTCLNTAKNLFFNIEQSLKRLKTDFIDLYQLHHFDPIIQLSETIDALEKAKQQGKIRYWGISNFNFNQIDELSKFHKTLPLTHQIKFNLFYDKIYSNLNDKSQKMNCKFIFYSVLGRGILTGKYLSGINHGRAINSQSIKNDLRPEIQNRVAYLNNLCNEFHIDLTSAVIAFTKLIPNQFGFIVGVRNLKQLKSLAIGNSMLLNEVFISKLWNLIENSKELPENSFGIDFK